MENALTLTNDMKLVLGLVGFTMAMFLFQRIRADLVALVVLVVLGVTGLIAPEEIFGGFSGNAVMSIIATMILGAGLTAPAHSTGLPPGCCGVATASSSGCC